MRMRKITNKTTIVRVPKTLHPPEQRHKASASTLLPRYGQEELRTLHDRRQEAGTEGTYEDCERNEDKVKKVIKKQAVAEERQ